MSVRGALLAFVEDVRVDGGSDHYAQAGDELEDSGEGKALPFAQGEELSHKHKQAQDGEHTGQHCTGLHRMEVILKVSGRNVGVCPGSVDHNPLTPQVCGNFLRDPPGIVNCGDEEKDDGDNVEDEDSSQEY